MDGIKLSISGLYALQIIDIPDMRSILDVDYVNYSTSRPYTLRFLDILNMKLTFDSDDLKYNFLVHMLPSSRYAQHEIDA